MSYVSILCNISSRYIKHSRVYTERHLTSAVCIRNSSPSFTLLDVWHNMRSTDRGKKKDRNKTKAHGGRMNGELFPQLSQYFLQHGFL